MDPTYYSIGDHTESLQIDYDPTVISYDALLEVFWQAHSATAPPYARQYASLILYHDDGQRQAAEESKRRAEERLGATLHTEILPVTTFYVAEDYHQKYELRSNATLLRALSAVYPDPVALMNSTAAARVNGYLAGYGTPQALEEMRTGLGLPREAQGELARIVARYHR